MILSADKLVMRAEKALSRGQLSGSDTRNKCPQPLWPCAVQSRLQQSCSAGLQQHESQEDSVHTNEVLTPGRLQAELSHAQEAAAKSQSWQQQFKAMAEAADAALHDFQVCAWALMAARHALLMPVGEVVVPCAFVQQIMQPQGVDLLKPDNTVLSHAGAIRVGSWGPHVARSIATWTPELSTASWSGNLANPGSELSFTILDSGSGALQVKHEEFKQGADQRAAAQGLEVYRLQVIADLVIVLFDIGCPCPSA